MLARSPIIRTTLTKRPMSLRYAAFDQSWKQTAESAVDMRVCDCCSTSTAVTADGVIAAFRDRSDKDIRDIAVSRFENGAWTPSTTVHDDNFEIFECPVNGPMIAARGTRCRRRVVHREGRPGSGVGGVLERQRTNVGRADPARRLASRSAALMWSCSTTVRRSRPGSSWWARAASFACGASNPRG